MDRALPGTINARVDSSRDGSKVIFLASSDRTPGTYYLLRTASKRLDPLFDAAERIKVEEMSELKPV